MASEAPNWADQWGPGGFGAMAEDDPTKTNKDGGGDNKKASGGFSKAKDKAIAGADKFRSGISMGIKSVKGFNWVKSKCQKKKSSSNDSNQ